MKSSKQRFSGCQFLLPRKEAQQLWLFAVAKDKITRTSAETVPLGGPFPRTVLQPDWQKLAQPRLSIACLPSGFVFVRVIQLPAGSPEEIPSMVEFELEKLSPLPTAQIVWSFEILEQSTDGLSTVLVVVAARNAVEEFLGNLESTGFVADRLEVPLVRELRSLQPTGDGIWIFVEDGLDERTVLAGWRIGGTWREVTLLRLAEGEAGADQLIQQLACGAWGGELAGWLQTLPPLHLLGSPEAAHLLAGPLETWHGSPVRVQPRTPAEHLAQEGTRYHLQPSSTSLVPTEVISRHRNQLIDRLWIKGLGNVGIFYLFAVFCYLAALKYQEHQLDDAKGESISLGKSYTNTLQLKERIAVIQGQIDLRFAALNAWRAAVEQLPESMTLSKLNFDKGRTLKLLGSVPAESVADVTRYNSALKKVMIDGQPLFASVTPANIASQAGPSSWSFEAVLRRSETP